MQIPLPLKHKLWGSRPRIDWSHPITRGLIGCYLPGSMRGHALIGPNLTSGWSNAPGPGSHGTTIDGPALRSNTSGQARGFWVTAPGNFRGLTAISLFWRGVLRGAPDGYCTLLGIQHSNADNPPYYVSILSADGTGYADLRAFYNSAGSSIVGNPINATGRYGQMISICSTGKVGVGVQFYVDAVPVGVKSAWSSAPTYDSTAQIVINQGPNATNRSPNADCNVGYFWNRDLTAAEVQTLQDDPYCFLAFPEEDIFSLLVGAEGPPADISGILSATEAGDTAQFPGTVAAPDVSGILLTTETADTAVFPAKVEWTGQLIAQEGFDASAIQVTAVNSGILQATETLDVAQFPGTVVTAGQITGTLNATEAADASIIQGQVTGVAGIVSATETADIAVFPARNEWQLRLVAQETLDVAQFPGSIASDGVSGTIAAVEGVDTAILRGNTAAFGFLQTTEAVDSASLKGLTAALGVLTAVEANDNAQISGTVPVIYTGVLQAVEGADVAAFRGNVPPDTRRSQIWSTGWDYEWYNGKPRQRWG